MCKISEGKDPQYRWIFKNNKVTDRELDDRISCVLANKAYGLSAYTDAKH